MSSFGVVLLNGHTILNEVGLVVSCGVVVITERAVDVEDIVVEVEIV